VGCVVGPKRGARLLRFARQASSGRAVQLGEHWVAELAFDRLRVLRPCRSAVLPSRVVWGDREAGSLTWDGWEITWRRDTAGRAGRQGLATWVTPGAGEIRGPRPGDRLRPLGATGRRPVRRLFMEARVPAGERAAYPVLVRDGEIVWVPGICRAAGAVPEAGAPAVRLEARRVGEPGRD
jgi:tRNA(Ile)-lysidine synthetase-like protein